MYFRHLTPDEAIAHRDLVIAREPHRLALLEQWMRDTGGPLDEMDASVASLVPLWDWFIGFVDDGCPGVRRDGRPDWYDVAHYLELHQRQANPATEEFWVAQFAAESLEHYLFGVCARLDPTARWELYERTNPDPTDIFCHSTGIQVAGDWTLPASNIVSVGTSRLINEGPESRAREPINLRRVFEARTPEGWAIDR